MSIGPGRHIYGISIKHFITVKITAGYVNWSSFTIYNILFFSSYVHSPTTGNPRYIQYLPYLNTISLYPIYIVKKQQMSLMFCRYILPVRSTVWIAQSLVVATFSWLMCLPNRGRCPLLVLCTLR